jgi:hypothetical protein
MLILLLKGKADEALDSIRFARVRAGTFVLEIAE